VAVFIGQFFLFTEVACICFWLFGFTLIWTKMGWATFRAIFPETHPVTPVEYTGWLLKQNSFPELTNVKSKLSLLFTEAFCYILSSLGRPLDVPEVLFVLKSRPWVSIQKPVVTISNYMK
jgi:hypothetical protein